MMSRLPASSFPFTRAIFVAATRLDAISVALNIISREEWLESAARLRLFEVGYCSAFWFTFINYALKLQLQIRTCKSGAIFSAIRLLRYRGSFEYV